MSKRVYPVLVFAIAAAIYVATLPKALLPGDSGELIAASRTLSIAHPPGYPLYVMTGKVVSSLLPWGSIAYRYNLLSALIISATIALVYVILKHLRVSTLVALATALGLGTLESFWLQATMAEVYALNALFTALLLYIALLSKRYGERSLVLLAFVGGLALSHHLSLVYPLVCALGVIVVRQRTVLRPRTFVVAVLLGLIGLSTWLYIPVRATLGPPLVWGRTDTLGGFISHITAQGYRWRLRDIAVAARAVDFARFFVVAAGQAGMAFIAAGLIGAVVRIRRFPMVGGCVVMVLLFAVHFAMYNIPDIESHIFPALIAWGVLAGVGLQFLTEAAARVGHRIGLAAALCCFIILGINLSAISPRQDEWFAEDYAHAIQESALEACGDSCIVITSGDISTFPLLYASLVEPGGPLVYDLAASKPAVIGAGERPAGIEQCAARAAEIFGRSKVALLGPMPRQVLGREPYICGMINVIERPAEVCRPPTDYPIRGVAEDPREYSSRLLSGSYYLHLARWYGQERDTTAVKSQIRLALASAPDDVGTFINAATLYLGMGLVHQAMQTARAAIKVDPDFFEAHDLLANILLSAGNVDEAISEYKAALNGNPSPAMLHSNLGNAYAMKGDQARAIEQFNTAIELDSTLVNAYIGMGRALDAVGRGDEALSFMRLARSKDPRSVAAYHAESSLLLRAGDCDQALASLRTGIGLNPGSPLLLADMGLCYLRLDSLDSAIVYLQDALQGDPSLLTARGNLAVAFERKGLREEAIREFQRYLETAPPGQHRTQALRALERLSAPGTSYR
jgi:tetratricopeptide (TPR) repeat protein